MLSAARLVSVVLIVASPLALGGTASAQEKTLQNDSFADGVDVAYVGRGEGETAASTFVPEAGDYPVRLLRLQIMFGGDDEGGMRQVTLRIWRDANPPQATPGELVHSEDIQLTSANSTFNEIDVSELGLTFDTPFRIGTEYQHQGFPGPARDTDGNTYPDRNWLFQAELGWYQSRNVLVEGDWVVRAVVLPTEVSPNNGNPNNGNTNNDNPNNAAAPLAVTSVAPTTASAAEDVQVSVFGSGFQEGMTIRVGSTALTDVAVQNETGAVGTLAAGGVPGTYDVIVQVGAETAVHPSGFTLTAVDGGDGGLMLSDIEPDTGTVGRETAVTLVGGGFDSDVTFTIGGDVLTDVVVQSHSVATATAPATLRVGTHPVVASRGEEEAILSPGFEVEGATSAAEDSGCSTAPGRVTGGALAVMAALLFVARLKHRT